MGKISAIKEATTFMADFHGVEIELREMNAGIALAVYGSGAFASLDASGDKGDQKIDDKTLRQMNDLARRVLVSPRIGSTTDDEADTITMEEAVDCGLAAFAAMTVNRRAADARGEMEGFTPPSGDQTGSESPKSSEG
jgi:hypothetical protein